MEVLDYYDDERVKRESGFLNKRNLLILAIVYALTFLFIVTITHPNPEEYGSSRVLLWFIEFIAAVISSVLLFLWALNTDTEPRSKLKALKKKYLEQRKEILAKHQYRYSVYNRIDEEIMCDSFQADKNGHVYIDISENDYVLDETRDEIAYHHITDNSDGHILTVREIRKFVKTGE